MGKPLWIPLWLSFLLQSRYSQFSESPNGASCCLLKYVMFLFVKVEEEKAKALLCLPAFSAVLWTQATSFSSHHPNCFCQHKHIFINFHISEETSSTGVDSTWLNNWTSPTLYNKLYRTIYLAKSHDFGGKELLAVAASGQYVHTGVGERSVECHYPQCPLTSPVEHKAKWKIVASRWLHCYS